MLNNTPTESATGIVMDAYANLRHAPRHLIRHAGRAVLPLVRLHRYRDVASRSRRLAFCNADCRPGDRHDGANS